MIALSRFFLFGSVYLVMLIQSIFDVSLEDKFEIKEQVQFVLTEIEKLGLDKLLVKFNG